MTKDNSRRSSIAGSAHAPSPRESGSEQPQQADQSSTQMSRAGSVTADSSKEILHATSTTSAESQSMIATNSASSNPPPIDVGAYGTRSRNRTGNSRPNYAEDKELDMELEAPVKESNGRKSTKAAESTNSDGGRSTTGSSRKTVIPENEQLTTTPNHHKESIPGTHTFSANPTSQSKKRKAASQSAVGSTLQTLSQTPTNGLSTPQAITRKASMAVHAAGGYRESNMMSFDSCGSRLKGKKLVADDGTVLQVNDHVYLVCEPPGEPYYLGRIMEFLHANNDSRQPIDALRLNWYYRPKDIGRKVSDTRQVFASMHSDVSPLTALRGKCQIMHRTEVDNLDDLRRTKHSFWYEKLYDRYIHRYYDVVPTSQVVNVPLEVKKVLDERWKYIIVEPARGKELTSAVKTCKRCSKYCASNDSVDCAVCKNTYHMSCVSPPLLKKPSRGFAWACGPCSKAQEKKLEARHTDVIMEGEDEELIDEEDDLSGALGDGPENGGTSSSAAAVEVAIKPGTAEQIHQASLWLFRYLGIHCQVEDALDYDDRIYPRASSRLGPRHQANIPAWPGRPVEFVKPVEIKKKYTKGGQKKDTKLAKETLAALEADKIAREKRPKWVMDEPMGYVHRGEDHENGSPNNTAKLLFKMPEIDERSGLTERGVREDEVVNGDDHEKELLAYMARVRELPASMGLPPLSTNVQDVALDLFCANGYDTERSLQALISIDRKSFREPSLNPTELKKFEDGVAKFGSEWHSIKKHVKTVSAADIVRFYYTWKKTPRGKQVWGNYTGRKGKKEAKKAEASASAGKLQDDVADDHDDSAFDNEKAFEKKRGFQCKFCAVRKSRQWRRAPNTAAGTTIPETPGAKTTGKDKASQLMVALCQRCAELWRHYAVQWEEIDDTAKKVAAGGVRVWKRKIDEELLGEIEAANLEELNYLAVHGPPTGPASSDGTPAPTNSSNGPEPPKKKLKGGPDQDLHDSTSDTGMVGQPKKKLTVEKPYVPPPPPPPPEPPKARVLPCAVCDVLEPLDEQHLVCKDCRMTVHRNCYGVVGENRSPSKWVCDMCSNDKNPQVSVQYQCMLCPVEHTEHDFVEPPKPAPKKKNEKDRERDRVEREKAEKDAEYFRKRQEDTNKPLNPREPLKRTANNNWVHVTCAVFTPEVKFGNAKALEPSEGIPSIPSTKYDEVCKACKQKGGACINCHQCRTSVHVECAHKAGYTLGFDITPVKGSRRDHANVVTINGETGTMTALVWCKDHTPSKTIVHPMNQLVEGTGLNALQLYVQNFKQADLTLTGTVRKANLVNLSTKISNPVVATAAQNRRTSTTATSTRGSVSHIKAEAAIPPPVDEFADKSCITCGIDVSPRWWPLHQPHPPTPAPEPSQPVIPDDVLNPNNVDGPAPVVDTPMTDDVAQSPMLENGDSHVALAVAALHQDTSSPPRISTPFPIESQCHKCHCRKVIIKEPTPTPLPPSPVREPSPAPPVVEHSASIDVPMPDVDMMPPAPQYVSWPQLPAFSTNTPYQSTTTYNGWQNESSDPSSVSARLNGSHSPHTNQGNTHQPNGYVQSRETMQGVPRSPHQNGYSSQAPNGYPRSRSPPRRMSSSGSHMQTASYSSYDSTRPPPPHLTNGGPPPRSPEHPFHHNSYSLPPFGTSPPFGTTSRGSPTMHRDSFRDANEHMVPDTRDPNNSQNNGVRPHERVNGGASASPSLRNLLS